MVAKLANNASSTLASAINNSVTTVSIASGDASKFPALAAGEWFPLTVVDASGNIEVMRVTARSSATLTVVRGQEGTTARAFAAGSKCDLRLTAAAAVAPALATDATAVTQAAGDNSKAVANTEFIQNAAVRADVAQSLTQAQQGRARANMGAGVLSGFRDKIINGNGAISQRAYTTVADDAYWCDRHYVLTQTAVITPTILSDVANGLPSMMRLTQSQATAQRMGNATILEATASKPLRGKTVTLGGRLRCSASQAIRYAILEWTGTADAVTSDVVANWASGSYTPGNFFLASNLTVAAVGSLTPAANALTDFALTASVSGSCNNLILVCWTEGTAVQNVALDMAWGLVEGSSASETYPYEARHPQQELALCQRYFETTGRFVSGVSGVGGLSHWGTYVFQVRKRATPSVAASSAFGSINGVDAGRVTFTRSADPPDFTGITVDAEL